MSTFKCKMCGGTLEIQEKETVATCEYCGMKQTLPRLDDDRRANLYDRANHFRRNNEFDKAESVYEKILNEDLTDAEAYWSLVLCRYGIEYVEDPATHKRVPTVNRTQFTSVFDDDNYKSALQYADSFQRSLYEEEAKAINELQKGILAISQQEEPFDVFICYKETDNNGRRTPDSVLANDLYHQLTQEGFRVFFSRITLEDKLGTAYEPYIFAALNSAKVMVVLGTKPEYFNAVWVKNEWSRYLTLIKQGQQKLLIPAYKDMDPYDLPEEFSHLQAQDMSKLGFMQDLIRGIKKIAHVDEPKPTVVKETVISAGNANTAALLKRAFMFLEDSDWDSADEYCEKVLDIDPENAQAYIGKTLVQEKCGTLDAFARKRKDLSERVQGETLQFAWNRKPIDEAVERFKVSGYLTAEAIRKLYHFQLSYHSNVTERKRQYRNEETYWAEHKLLSRAEKFATGAVADNLEQVKKALFADLAERIKQAEVAEAAEIRRVQEAYSQHLSAADAQAEHLHAEAIKKKVAYYQHLLQVVQESGNVKMLHETAQKFEELGDFLDSKNQAELCRTRATEEQARLTAERIAARAAKFRKICMISGISAVSIVAVIIVITQIVIPNVKYNKAVALMEAGAYEEAIAAFRELDGYKDSEEQIAVCKTGISDRKYHDAFALMEAEQYDEAIAAFQALNGYKDSEEQIAVCKTGISDRKYHDAFALMEAEQYDEAIAAFQALNGYKDSEEQIAECKRLTLKKPQVGDYVFFGSYEQDNDTSNGKEAIEWLVLEKTDNKILVISKYALDCLPYHTIADSVTWETCSLRKWLNGTFLTTAFSSAEQSMIPTATVSADKNPRYSTYPGNSTQDKVFLLSISEVNKYFSSDSTRQCQPTSYAVANGAVSTTNGNCWWWLRSPGNNQNYAAYVYSDCGVTESGYYVNFSYGAVRPALWIDLTMSE